MQGGTLVEFVLHSKAALSPFDDPRFNDNSLAERRRCVELRARFHQRNAYQSELLQHLGFAKSGFFKQRVCTSVEVFEKPRKIHYARGVAITPFHVNLSAIAQHCDRLLVASWSLPYRRRSTESVFLTS